MRCNSCNTESEVEAKYCRWCGASIKILLEHSAGKLDTEDKPSTKNTKIEPAPMLGSDFYNQSPPKMVVPLGEAVSSTPAMSRNRRHGKLLIRTIISICLVIFALIVFKLTRRSTSAVQPQPAQAQTPADYSLSRTSPATPTPVVERAISAPVKKVVSHSEPESSGEEFRRNFSKKERAIKKLDLEAANKKRTIQNLNKKIAEKKSKLRQLEERLALAESELKELNTEIASAQGNLKKLNREIALTNDKLRKSRRELALSKLKKGELALLNSKLEGLKQKISQRTHTIRNLQRDIDWIKRG